MLAVLGDPVDAVAGLVRSMDLTDRERLIRVVVIGGGTLVLCALVLRQRGVLRDAQRSEERYRLVVETAPDMILTISESGIVTSVNEAVLAQSAFSREQILSMNFSGLIVAEDVPVAGALFVRCLRGETVPLSLRFTRRDDQIRWIQGTAAPVRDRDRFTEVLVICRDVTEDRTSSDRLQSALAALQESQEQFRTAFASSAVGMTLTSLDGRFLCVNLAFSEMIGYGEEELTSLGFGDVTHPEDRAVSVAALPRLLSGELRTFETEKRYIHKQGHVVWALLSVSAVHDATGAPTHFVSQMVDMTERRRADAERQNLQLQLAQSQKMQAVGQLVSGVAHELNNPLAAILGFSEILLQDCKDAETREALNVIFGQAQRSRAIVRDLLSFARQREGRQRAETDMGAMLQRVTRALMPAAETAGATLEAAFDGPYPALSMDTSGVEQVLTNLVMNAVQAVPPGGTVRVGARVSGEWFKVIVEDTGSGIPADVLPHIFEPFFTTKPVGQGTGLGLSVSLGIVEQHGGTLRAENRTADEGRGARFVVTLPLAAGADGARPVTPPATHAHRPAAVLTPVRQLTVARRSGDHRAVAPPTGKRPRLLVIDDETPIRIALRRFFERRGWIVDECGDGDHALRVLGDAAADHYDVVICDLKMPGVSGIELYGALSLRQPMLVSRLIFATGDVASTDAAAFLQQVRCPVLEKPYELGLLAEIVDRVRAGTQAA